MTDARSRRQIKTPKKYTGEEGAEKSHFNYHTRARRLSRLKDAIYILFCDLFERAESRKTTKKYVLRLLSEKDVTENLLGEEIFLLWPDDGLWYPAEIQKVDARKHLLCCKVTLALSAKIRLSGQQSGGRGPFYVCSHH